MSGRIVLDTSVIVEAIAGNALALAVIAGAGEALVPVIALGELVYGAENSGRREAELVRVEAFVAAFKMLGCGPETAHVYGEIKHQLRRRGRLIPDNDIWIAATAREHGLTLATRDGHFREVEALALVAW